MIHLDSPTELAMARSGSRPHARALSGVRGQRILGTAGVLLAVPLTGGFLSYSHTHLMSLSVAVAACMAVAAVAIEGRRYPFHLMPIAGVLVRAAGPLLGISLAWLISVAFRPVPLNAFVEALLGCWLILAVVLVVVARLRLGLRIRVAVLGSPELALSLKRELALANMHGYEVIGWIGAAPAEPAKNAVSYLGPPDQVAEFARTWALDLIVFGVRESGLDAARDGSATSLQLLETLSTALVFSPTRLIGANQFFEEHFGHTPLGTMNAAWFQYMLHPRFRTASPLSKRLFDLLVAALLVAPALVVLALCALAIKLDDRGPVFYRQRRVGEAGRRFEVLKLRTMSRSAEVDGAPQWATANDGRVTRVGRVLRRAHLDELPQLFNILRGEMSLVGPRPERPEFITQLEHRLPYYDRRLAIKPGLTGWAQVRIGYAGSDLGSAWKLAHDLYYLKHRSVVFDAMIMLETLATPIRDSRMAGRAADEIFVGAAVREHEAVATHPFAGHFAEPAVRAPATTRATVEPTLAGYSSLRAYLAGISATVALIAGAVIVFGALATYVAFSGTPIGFGSKANEQATVATGGAVGPRAPRVLARAPDAVAATTARAPGRGATTGGQNAHSPATTPSDTPPSAPRTVNPPPDPSTDTSPPGSGSGGSGDRPLGGAISQVSGATGLPLNEATSGITDQADQIVHDLGEPPGLPPIGAVLGTP